MNPSSSKTTRVLMVCLGNICRSPTAEAVLRKKVHEAGLDERIEVDSAGTADYHVDSPPDRRAVAHGERRGLKMKHLRGRQVSRDDFDRFDFILAMDDDNLADLQSIRPAGSRAKLALLMSYAPEAGSREVPDPYYGGAEGFERVLTLTESAADGFIAFVRSN
jgi:protein-tyrosine phosphatase